jgi:hypothetical protein
LVDNTRKPDKVLYVEPRKEECGIEPTVTPLYSLTQLEAYADETRREALEEAAAVATRYECLEWEQGPLGERIKEGILALAKLEEK